MPLRFRASYYDCYRGPVRGIRALWTQFTLALTEVADKKVHHLVAIYWGYDRMADGEVRAAAIRRPTTEEMRAHGKALKRMYPDWTFT